MRLALAAGRLDVDQLALGLTCRQVAEWEAFERLEGGIGDRAAWLRSAQLLASFLETKRDPKKRATPFTVKELLPWIERAPATQLLRAQLQHLVGKPPKQRRR